MVFCNLPPDSLLCRGLPIFEIYVLLCWLVEIVEYLFGGSPLPLTPERLQEWYAKI